MTDADIERLTALTEDVRARQDDFLADWGGQSWEDACATTFWLGASPDGRFVGLRVDTHDGQRVRVAIPLQWLEMWCLNNTIAGTLAVERAQRAQDGSRQA